MPNLIRSAPTPPAHPSIASSSHPRQILFRHPHPQYDDTSNVLLKLLAPEQGGGLYAQYALDACGIIAGNRWDGWLSQTKDATITLSAIIDPESILHESNYYFHLPCGTDNSPYPIVPTFQEWRFPHDNLPPSWTAVTRPPPPTQTFSISGLSVALHVRDASCRISGWAEGTQVAHVVPQAEEDWFRANGMARYNISNSDSMYDIANTFLLRADLHIAFDKPKFVIVPKTSSEADTAPCLVVHMVEASDELEDAFHNCRTQHLFNSIEFMFARFAWTIFPWLESFLKGRKSRWLTGLNIAGEAAATSGVRFSPEECAQLGAKASRSRSPKKRGRTQAALTDDTAAFQERMEERMEEEEETRPRKRARYYSSSPFDTLDSVKQQQCLDESPPPSPPRSIQSSRTPPVSSQLLPESIPEALRQSWLQQERIRSDPDKKWDEEKEWADQVSEGQISLDKAGARRWLEIKGAEFYDFPP